jgi:hypothetical protein
MLGLLYGTAVHWLASRKSLILTVSVTLKFISCGARNFSIHTVPHIANELRALKVDVAGSVSAGMVTLWRLAARDWQGLRSWSEVTMGLALGSKCAFTTHHSVQSVAMVQRILNLL